jgi:tripartite-type tricarboxylate transporter receptor subunit TctC
MRTIGSRTILWAFCFAIASISANAQSYPDRPVKMIVPYTAGGGTDTVARAIAKRLSDKWGQPVVVDNRPGAGTTLGAGAAAKATPDGYTLLFTDSASFVINPHIYSKLPYDPIKDLAPIALVVRLAPVLTVATNSPAKTIPDLIAYAKANPGKLSYASPGVGSYPHVAMEHLKHLTGIDILHVPYRGSTPALTDLIGGRVTMYMVSYSVFEALDRDGKVKVIAAATDKRLPKRPDLPTIAETVKDYSVNVWFGLAAPAGTPEKILDKIHDDVNGILKDPKFIKEFVEPQSYIVDVISRKEFADRIQSELQKWKELVKISKVPPR